MRCNFKVSSKFFEMKKSLFSAFLFLIVTFLIAQNRELPVDFSRYGTPVTGSSYLSTSVTNEIIREFERIQRSRSPEELNEYLLKHIEGTPYMNNQFEKGEILSVDGDLIKGVLLRFNIFGNKMEVKDNEILYEISNEMISRIKIGERNFDYLTFTLDNKKQAGYLEMVQDGDWKLYCRYAKRFREAQPQKAMQDKPANAGFSDLPEVYIIKNNKNEAIGFRNKKELLNILSNHKAEIEKYIKSQKLKPDKADDLKKLLDYYQML